jgi:hypothetical protein
LELHRAADVIERQPPSQDGDENRRAPTRKIPLPIISAGRMVAAARRMEAAPAAGNECEV